MPNWVYNYLDIAGPEEDIVNLKTQLNKPFTVPVETMGMGDISTMGFPTKPKEVKYSNPVFAFWNVINPFDMGVTPEEYAQQPKEDFTDNSWYSWNNNNWGCKWDVAVADDDKYPETEVYHDQPDAIGYKFNTPWGPALPVIGALSVQYPNLTFTLSYEEETGWGGEIIFINGNGAEISEYGWKCRECDHMEDETPYCEECDFDTCPSCGYNESDEACEEHREGHNAHLLA